MKKILYFVRGGVASPEQKKEAAELGAFFRSSSMGANDFVEKCDAVAGDVPERYKHFPVVGSVVFHGQEQAPPPPMETVAAQAEAEAETPQAQPETMSRAEEIRTMLMGKTVAEQREFAKEHGIPLPRDINTKEEIADYVSRVLTQS